MNHYYTSDDERVAKSVIDRRVHEAKANALSKQFWEYGYNFCSDCLKSNGVILDLLLNDTLNGRELIETVPVCCLMPCAKIVFLALVNVVPAEFVGLSVNINSL